MITIEDILSRDPAALQCYQNDLILQICVDNNIKIKFINAISKVKRFNIFTQEFESFTEIEVLQHQLMFTRILKSLLPAEYRFTYIGEYNDTQIPKNMWVKMTEAERSAYKLRKNPCANCSMEFGQCRVEECQFLNKYRRLIN